MSQFLPCEKNIDKSVQSLDNLILNKQILEVKTMINAVNIDNTVGLIKGYYNHLVAQFQKEIILDKDYDIIQTDKGFEIIKKGANENE